MQETEVVAARPVLRDLAVHDAPDVNERPGHFDPTRVRTCEQRHGRCLMHSPHREVLCDELALGDEVVLFYFAIAQIMANDVEDLPQTLAALRPRSVVDH